MYIIRTELLDFSSLDPQFFSWNIRRYGRPSFYQTQIYHIIIYLKHTINFSPNLNIYHRIFKLCLRIFILPKYWISGTNFSLLCFRSYIFTFFIRKIREKDFFFWIKNGLSNILKWRNLFYGHWICVSNTKGHLMVILWEERSCQTLRRVEIFLELEVRRAGKSSLGLGCCIPPATETVAEVGHVTTKFAFSFA